MTGALACLSSVVAAGGAPTPPRELGGVRLGMTLQEATDALSKHQPPYQISSTRAPAFWTPGGSYVNTLGAGSTKTVGMQSFRDGILVHFSMPPNPSRVIAIRHTAFLAPDEQVTLANLTSSLRDKFGAEPTNTAPGAPHFWAWGNNGAPLAGEASRPCSNENDWIGALNQNEPLPATPRFTNTPCGTVAYATYPASPPIVSQLYTSLWDIPALGAAEAAAIGAIATAKQQQQSQALDKASKNKPSL